MKNKATTKNKVLFRAVLAVFLLAFNMSVQSAVELPNGIYHETVDDLVVKVMGGYVKAQRTWYAGKWHHNRAWNNLQIEYNALDGSVSRLGRNYDVYEKANSGLYTYADNTKSLSKTESGYRWTDKHGNWIDYAKDGRIIKYGDRNNVEVSFIYNAEGQRTGVKDHFGNQILWYEYNATGQVTSVRDHADLAQARIVKYQYTDGLLTQVIDVLGNTWSYSYKWTKTDSGSSSLGTTGSGGGASGISTSRMDYTLLLTSRTDPEGRTVTIEYNPNKRVASVKKADGTGPTYEYGYDKTKKEYYTRETQSSGRIDETWFNKDGEVIRRDVNGLTVETVKIDGNTYTHTNELGHQTIRQYDNRKNLIKETYPDGNSKSWKYDGKYSNVLEFTNERGVVTKYEYDEFGNRIRMIEAVGYPEERTTEYTYDEYGNMLSEKRLADAVTEVSFKIYTYDSKGNVVTKSRSVTSKEAQTINYDSYNRQGKLLEWRDGRGNIWKQEFDAMGQRIRTTNPLGNSIRYAYDGAGNLVRFIDPAGYVTSYTFNTKNQLELFTDASGAEQRYEYDDKGRMIIVYDRANHPVYRGYDSQDRVNELVDGVGNTINLVYGIESSRNVKADRLAAINYPSYIQEMKYDTRGRLIERQDILDNDNYYLTKYDYDSTNNLIRLTDSAGKVTTYEYDSLNRFIKVTYPDASTVSYSYDNRDNLLSVTNERGVVIRRYTYDRRNRATQIIWPGGQSHSYIYDSNSNLIEMIDAKGQIRRNKYDVANRLIQSQYLASDTANPDKTVTFSYDERNLLSGYDDGTTSAEYDYDAMKRKISELLNLVGFTTQMAFTYTPNGLKKSFTDPTGVTVNYNYDSANRLIRLDLPGEGPIVWNQYQWSSPSRISYPGGSTRTLSYDPLLQVKRLTSTDPAQNKLLDTQYQYDAVGNIQTKTTEHGAYVYHYDNRDRLTAASNPTLPDKSWTYDSVGNRTSDSTIPGTWQYDNANALKSYGSTTLERDANGSIIAKTNGGQITNYIYNTENRLSELKDTNGTTIARYGYDPFGRRIWKEINGERTWFVYSTEGLVAEFDASGTVIQSYGYQPQTPYGTSPLYTRTSKGYAYYQVDHLGTPQALITKNGKIVWQARQRAFGVMTEVVTAIVNPLRFPGQYYDQETGLHYNYHRYYDPTTGQYITSDPIGLQGGLNTYGYVGARPTIKIDNDGLLAEFTSIEGHAVIGVGVTYVKCTDEKCVEHTFIYRKICIGTARGGGISTGVVAGMDGENCRKPRFEGYSLETNYSYRGVGVNIGIGVNSDNIRVGDIDIPIPDFDPVNIEDLPHGDGFPTSGGAIPDIYVPNPTGVTSAGIGASPGTGVNITLCYYKVLN